MPLDDVGACLKAAAKSSDVGDYEAKHNCNDMEAALEAADTGDEAPNPIFCSYWETCLGFPFWRMEVLENQAYKMGEKWKKKKKDAKEKVQDENFAAFLIFTWNCKKMQTDDNNGKQQTDKRKNTFPIWRVSCIWKKV